MRILHATLALLIVSSPALAQEEKRHHAHDDQPDGIEWYLTLHGGTGGDNIVGLDERGQVIHDVLSPPPAQDAKDRELRGMAHLADGSLLVVNAYHADTRILHYGPSGEAGTRALLGTFSAYDASANPALVHTYALAQGPDGTIYASDQDTNTVVRLAGIGTTSPGTPLASPASLGGLGLPPGVLIPSRKVSPTGLVEVRGIAFGPDGLLYVADKGASRVTAVDPATGSITRVVADASHGLKGPIQVLFTHDGTAMFIGDNKAKRVFKVDLASGAVSTFLPESLCPEEPSSLALDKEHLLVGDRKQKRVDKFSLTDPQKREDWAHDLPQPPEFLIPASGS